jgi:arginase
MPKFVIIEAPSILGLKPTGVERLPEALEKANLLGRLDGKVLGRIEAPPYDPERDRATLMLNPHGIRDYSLKLANAVSAILQKNQFPIVLGGDCGIVIGNVLALRRLGKYGLFFIDSQLN